MLPDPVPPRPPTPPSPPAGPLPLLYSFRRCPYAMRARLAIRVAGVPVALREVVLRDKPAALLAASPKATVPVLQLPGGVVLEQSLDIMAWALARHDPADWLHPAAHAEMQALITLNDGPFKQALDRYKYPGRQPDPDLAGSAARARDDAVELLLAPLEQRLSGQRWLLRDSPCLADMALLPFVRQFAAVDAAWFATAPGLERVRGWLAGFCGSALLASVMQKIPPWRPGEPEPLV